MSQEKKQVAAGKAKEAKEAKDWESGGELSLSGCTGI